MSAAKTDSKTTAQPAAPQKAPEVPTLSALEEDDEFEEFVAEGELNNPTIRTIGSLQQIE